MFQTYEGFLNDGDATVRFKLMLERDLGENGLLVDDNEVCRLLSILKAGSFNQSKTLT